MQKKPVQRRLLIPLIVIVLILIIASGSSMVLLQKRRLEKSSLDALNNTHKEMSQLLEEQSRFLSVLIEPLIYEPELINALNERDRDKLLKNYSPLFSAFKKQFAITHFYFHAPDRINLVRIHKPEKYGDLIDRFTLLKAERTLETASGLEIGPLGTFTLRVVRPVIRHGSLIGYIELGKEIEDILDEVHRISGCHLAVSLQKENLNRNNWESGMRMLGRECKWDHFKNDVLIYSTISPFPVQADPFVGKVNHSHRRSKDEIRFDDSYWRIMVEPFYDVSGKDVGDLIVMKNTTAIKAADRKIFMLGVVGISSVSFFFCIFVFILVKNADKKILSQQTDLRKSEEKFRAIFNNANDGILIGDAATKDFVMANDKICEMLGYTKEEIIQLSVRDIHPTESIEDVLHNFDRQLNLEIRIAENLPLTRKDGTVFYADVSSSPVTISGRDCLLGIFRDITERKKNRETIIESEKRYRTILQTAADGFWVTDAKANILEVNDAYCRMSGYSEKELLSMSVYDLEINDPKEIEKQTQEIIEKGFARFEAKHRRKDGSTFDVEVILQSHPDNREVFFSFNRDITERKSLESQIAQAQKMESVGRLAGGVAHDFNNMLSVIIGNIELAMDGVAVGDPIRVKLQEALTAAMRSADVTRQLLGFARKQTIAPTMLDLNNKVEEILKMLKRLIGEDIELSWIPGKALWPVRLDPGQVDQILTNLCVNARDAIVDVGEITIETVNTVIDESYCNNHPGVIPGEFVQLTVSDNGLGMDAETLGNIFEPFFTTKSAGKGTGLGLSTVYGIVRQNNGFINVYSEPGKGTTFKIYLSRHQTGRVERSKKDVGSLSRHGNETILVVEDETSILELIKNILEKLGYTIFAAKTPGEAIAIAQEHDDDIDLLLTDVVMPEMNGRDLAGNILLSCPKIKRLFMSGYTADVISHHGVLEDGVYFIQKPFSMKTLGDKIREILDA